MRRYWNLRDLERQCTWHLGNRNKTMWAATYNELIIRALRAISDKTLMGLKKNDEKLNVYIVLEGPRRIKCKGTMAMALRNAVLRVPINARVCEIKCYRKT